MDALPPLLKAVIRREQAEALRRLRIPSHSMTLLGVVEPFRQQLYLAMTLERSKTNQLNQLNFSGSGSINLPLDANATRIMPQKQRNTGKHNPHLAALWWLADATCPIQPELDVHRLHQSGLIQKQHMGDMLRDPRQYLRICLKKSPAMALDLLEHGVINLSIEALLEALLHKQPALCQYMTDKLQTMPREAILTTTSTREILEETGAELTMLDSTPAILPQNYLFETSPNHWNAYGTLCAVTTIPAIIEAEFGDPINPSLGGIVLVPVESLLNPDHRHC